MRWRAAAAEHLGVEETMGCTTTESLGQWFSENVAFNWRRKASDVGGFPSQVHLHFMKCKKERKLQLSRGNRRAAKYARAA